ncbi:MAG: OmpA family protein [Bacteroidetes bacterium]|nr:OmpA family protein [Bacteroidota bacterium]
MKKVFGIFVAFLILCLAVSVSAQINIGRKINNNVNNRINNKIDRGINKGLDEVEKGIKNDGSKKDDKAKPEEKNQQKTTKQDDKGAVKQEPDTKSEPALKSYSNYDFVPGDKVLLYEDFSQDAVGDFPALWTTNKSGEINTLNISKGNWLNLNATEGNWWFLKPIDFPKNFIVEFDVVPKKTGGRYALGVAMYGENSFKEMSDPFACKTGLIVNVAKTIWETQGLKAGNTKITGNSALKPVEEEKVNHVIIWVQNRRVRIYHKGEKVLDMPTNLYDDSKFTRLGFLLYRGASCSSYISNIKVTSAAPDTRNKLLTEGKLVTYGIYFDVNKDVVKPESYGTLNDIAKILNEVPDVKVKIVGHTDSDGADAANLDLSKRRAAAVKNELVKSFGVNGDRLSTDGMGESQPVAPNDTPTNKALNRRVEFIKL